MLRGNVPYILRNEDRHRVRESNDESTVRWRSGGASKRGTLWGPRAILLTPPLRSDSDETCTGSPARTEPAADGRSSPSPCNAPSQGESADAPSHTDSRALRVFPGSLSPSKGRPGLGPTPPQFHQELRDKEAHAHKQDDLRLEGPTPFSKEQRHTDKQDDESRPAYVHPVSESPAPKDLANPSYCLPHPGHRPSSWDMHSVKHCSYAALYARSK